jgi:tetratricopeptide (TPR) repeat protein
MHGGAACAQAPDERGGAVTTTVDASALAADLAAISRELADARAVFDERVDLRPETALERLGHAQVAFLEEDYPRAVARLLDLTARPDFQRSPGYGEALTWLAESLWQLGLEAAAATELRRAIAQPALPTAYGNTLRRYLTIGATGEPVEALRAAWQRHQDLRTDGPLTQRDREIRYLYARALYRRGATTEAEALFEAVDDDDPYAVEARYHVAVIQLSRGELKAARATFESARALWTLAGEALDERRGVVRDDDPDYWDVEPSTDGPPLVAMIVSDGAPDAALDAALDEERQRHLRKGQVVHLAIARLDASRENLDSAVRHYRLIPPGSPDHPVATHELVWALYRAGQHARAARLVDQLLAGRGDDRTAAELATLKAHLLALAADYTASEENYRALETALTRRRDELEGDLSQDARVFPEAVLAWTSPETTDRARRLEGTLVEQEEALAEARELITELRAAFASPELLPGVRAGKAVHTRLSAALVGFRQRVDALAADGEGAAAKDLADSADRLAERLERFSRAVDGAEGRWRARLDEVLGAEGPALDALERRLTDETALARRLGMAMALGAREQLETLAADAHFRQIDLAWWRVDEMRRRIKAAREAQRAVLGPMEAEVMDFRRERAVDPIPYASEAEFVAE